MMLLTVAEPRYWNGPRAWVPRLSHACQDVDALFRHLNDERRRGRLGFRRPQAGGEFQARQVVREEQVALQGADIGRPFGCDLGSVVGKEIAVSRELVARPLHPVDITFDNLDAQVGAPGRKALRRHHRARQHVAVAAVLLGDAAGKVVDRLKRHRAADEIGIERRKLRLAIHGRADNADAADRQLGAVGAGRRDGARERDRRSGRPRAWRRRLREALALAARQIARRYDLRYGNGRQPYHRQHCRESAQAGEHHVPLKITMTSGS